MVKNEIQKATRLPGADHEDGLSQSVLATLSPRDNRLLRALPSEEYARLLPFLQRVKLENGEVLCEQASELNYVYFPVSAMLSLQYALGDGSTCEIAGIGSEGLIGASLFMFDSVAPGRALVQIGGWAYRGSADRLAMEFSRGGWFQRLMLRYVQMQFMEVTQTSICNSRHSVEQRLSRWLLGTLDRGVGRELIATHERLGEILGVRRESVTAAAGALQDQGAIRYCRGRLTVLDRRILEPRACECYAVVRQLHARLLQMGGEPTRAARERNAVAAVTRALRDTQTHANSWSQPALA